MEELPTQREEKRIRAVAREYRNKGYRVIVNPSPKDLPLFLQTFKPDLIAAGKDETVVVEVKSKTTLPRTDDLRELAKALENREGWRFELVVTNPKRGVLISGSTELPDESALRKRLDEAESLNSRGQLEAALVLAWSAAEGYLRLMGEQEQISLENHSTSYILKKLYSIGLLEQRSFEILDRSSKKRNSLVHGFAVSHLNESDVRDLANEVIRLQQRRQKTGESL